MSALMIVLQSYCFLSENGKLFVNLPTSTTTSRVLMNVESHKNSGASQILSEYLERTHRRRTPERFTILSAAESLKGHFSVERLCRVLEKDGERIARATVYNTVEMFLEAGILASRCFDGSTTVYELAGEAHHHLVCSKCGRVKDVRDPALDEYLRTRRYSAFTPAQFSLTVHGVCSACARRAKAGTKKVNSSSKKTYT